MSLIEEKKVLEYIYDTLSSIKYGQENIDARYHHNSSYKYAPSLVRYGILTLDELNEHGVINLSEDQRKILNAEDHVNGTTGVSLSVVGLDDIWRGEEEYNPLSPKVVDFLVSPESIPVRSTMHYANEFVHNGSIKPSEIQSMDVRLIQLLQNKDKYSDETVKTIIDKYNNLIEAADFILSVNPGIVVREMSNGESYALDVNKLSRTPKITTFPQKH